MTWPNRLPASRRAWSVRPVSSMITRTRCSIPGWSTDCDAGREHVDSGETPSTLWYHDHFLEFTGPNVYRGLAGLFLVFDRVSPNTAKTALDIGDETQAARTRTCRSSSCRAVNSTFRWSSRTSGSPQTVRWCSTPSITADFSGTSSWSTAPSSRSSGSSGGSTGSAFSTGRTRGFTSSSWPLPPVSSARWT